MLIGWSGLLVPSMVRSVEHDFVVSDAVLGAYYLAYVVSVTLGLAPAMLGTGVLAAGCAAAVVAVGRRPAPAATHTA